MVWYFFENGHFLSTWYTPFLDQLLSGLFFFTKSQWFGMFFENGRFLSKWFAPGVKQSYYFFLKFFFQKKKS